ncbi:type IV secretory system conjugative DNA transfer family protein [Stenotrophomonas geniculata]|uniref:type IV secretory system conjugative DNA transfer family protein n=1 Tax=Stenotrophomonas geniculata TaxID=86188 RepID=UPI003D352440
MTHSPRIHTPRSSPLRRTLLASLIALAAAGTAPTSFAQSAPTSDTLKRLMRAEPAANSVRLSPVREAALRASARTLGTQTGLIERAQEIERAVDARRVEMERTFRFGDLVIGAGVLPPVIVHTENAATVTNDTMRIAGALYQRKQPARFFSGAPSWRDWLLMGLPSASDMPEVPQNEQLLPRDSNERAFWEREVQDAYFSGRAQAQEILDHNLAMLEEVYTGMRVFYDLYQRNMVSAPVIAKSQEIVTQDDPNTIVVGDTFFRITMPSEFKTNPGKWNALQATPTADRPLPVVPGYDPAQVKEAFEIHKVQMARREAEKEAARRGVKLPDAEIAPVVPAPPPAPPMPKNPIAAPALPVQVGAVQQQGEIRYRVEHVQAARPAPMVAPERLDSPPTVMAPQPMEVEISRPLFSIPTSTRQ